MEINDFAINEEAISHILDAVKELATTHSEIAFVVDLEGVIFPFHMNRVFDTAHSPAWETHRVQHIISGMPKNHAMLHLIQKLAQLPGKISVVSGSQLDAMNEGHLYKSLESVELLDAGHRILKQYASKAYKSQVEPLAEQALLIFLNDDITDDGLPPKVLLHHFYQRQYTALFQVVPCPRFTLNGDGDYFTRLLNVMTLALQVAPVRIQEILHSRLL